MFTEMMMSAGGGGTISSGLVILYGMRNIDYSNPQMCANVSNIEKVNVSCTAKCKIYGVADDNTMTVIASDASAYNDLDVSEYNRLAWLCPSPGNSVTITVV